MAKTFCTKADSLQYAVKSQAVTMIMVNGYGHNQKLGGSRAKNVSGALKSRGPRKMSCMP
jgi:hypothetical protein